MSKVWILVAESSRAKIYLTDNNISDLKEIQDLSHPESRQHESGTTSDLPGRNAGNAGGSHHAMEGQTGIKEHEADNFARVIDSLLEHGRINGDYDKLAVIAAPAFLGSLRKSMNPNVTRLVSLEMDKDLVQASEADLRSHLPKHL